jgi:hypothetical protein
LIAFYRLGVVCDTPPKDRTYVFARGRYIVDGQFHFGDGVGRYINAARKGNQRANVYFGNWNEKGQYFPIKTYARAEACKKGGSKTTGVAVKKGQEFFISYS